MISVKFNPTKAMLSARGLEARGRVQKHIDSEVIRRNDKYVPFYSGMLKQSAKLGTVIGSGEVIYKCIHARRNYYENQGFGKQGLQRGGLRGKQWFERMKADDLEQIIDSAAKVAGGKRG